MAAYGRHAQRGPATPATDAKAPFKGGLVGPKAARSGRASGHVTSKGPKVHAMGPEGPHAKKVKGPRPGKATKALTRKGDLGGVLF